MKRHSLLNSLLGLTLLLFVGCNSKTLFKSNLTKKYSFENKIHIQKFGKIDFYKESESEIESRIG